MARKTVDIVLAALRSSDGFISAQEVHQRATDLGDRIGLATVYRALRLLVATDQVDALYGDDGAARYRYCGNEHHHHLVCRQCNFTVEIEAAVVEEWAARLAGDQGFSDLHHVLEVSGVCAACRSSI